MSRIQFDLKIDLPRAIGSAWNVPIGLLRVLLEVVEERRLVALGDAVEDREVDLQRLLDLVEHAADARRPPGRETIASGLRSASRIDVELGPDALHGLREQQAEVARRAVLRRRAAAARPAARCSSGTSCDDAKGKPS